MKQYVIDANVVVKWFFDERFQKEAISLLHPDIRLFAPDNIRDEILNVIIKKEKSMGRLHLPMVPRCDCGWWDS